MNKKVTLLHNDCLVELPKLKPNSVDAVVTDPQYGLINYSTELVKQALQAWLQGESFTSNQKGFMGKEWDNFVPGPETWKQVYRVMKPGAHAVVFAGARTVDLTGIALRLAGFEIRDSILLLGWIQASGFSKSYNIGKKVSEGQGWGTLLKPTNEPILLIRKPLEGTIVQNFKKYGTGGLNIDKSKINNRLPPNTIIMHHPECEVVGQKEIEGYVINSWDDGAKPFGGGAGHKFTSNKLPPVTTAIWACHPECHTLELNKQAKSKKGNITRCFPQFQYVLKATPKEKNYGCDEPNKWSAVKPVKLMSWLVNLLTPLGGVVLDNFMGTGTTGVACILNGFQFIGIEQEQEAFEIAEQRIKAHK